MCMGMRCGFCMISTMAGEPYWRDAVLVPEGKTKHAAFVADNSGPNGQSNVSSAGRQATGMATWFQVTNN